MFWAFSTFLDIINGVNIKIGIVNAINNVSSSVTAIVNTTALVAPTNNERNEPTHVGHAINSPVVAPIPPNPPDFFVIEIAFTANAVFIATRYDTVICNTRLIGITCIPICSVIYAINFGTYPRGPQHGVICADGISAP